MAAFFKFQDFTEQLIRGVHDFDAHTFKVYLTNAAPDAAADAVKADLAEIAGGNGYTAGGAATTITLTEVAGVTTVLGTEITWTAAGGSIGPFRYAVLVNDTSASKNLIGAWDYGSSLTLAAGEGLNFKPSNTSPGALFTLT